MWFSESHSFATQGRMFGIPTYKNNMDIKRVVFVSGWLPYIYSAKRSLV